jgi:hypothetical protein
MWERKYIEILHLWRVRYRSTQRELALMEGKVLVLQRKLALMHK